MAFDEASWLSLVPAPGETLRAALARVLREAIVDCALREGTRLPSSRALAKVVKPFLSWALRRRLGR